MHAIERMLSWSVKLKDATAHALPMRNNTRAFLVNLVHTPSLVTYQQKHFTYGTASEPPSPSHYLSA